MSSVEIPRSDDRIRELEQKLSAMPGSRTFVALAEEYRRAGRYQEALRTLQEGLARHPGYLSAQIAAARLYQEMGHSDEAIAAFSGVLAADRENLVAAKSLAELQLAAGNREEAIKKYKLFRAISGDRSVDDVIAMIEAEMQVPALPAISFPEPLPFLSEPEHSEPESPDPLEPSLALPPSLWQEEGEERATISTPGEIETGTETGIEAEAEVIPPGVLPPARTLADLYLSQGHIEEGRQMLQRLHDANPDDENVTLRLARLDEPDPDSAALPAMPAPAPKLVDDAKMPSAGAREHKIAILRQWLARVQTAAERR